jgi:regulator of RNase E activity RraA
MGVMAVNIPVTVCSMAVAPGDIVHMDVNGAVRFPREYLADVLSKCKELSEIECKKIEMLGSTSDVELLSKYMLGVYD